MDYNNNYSTNNSYYYDSLVEDYFKDVRNIETLSDEEIEKLFEQVAKNDTKAFQHLIEANLKLVISIAKHFAHNKMMFLDLIQEGNIGLIKSIKKFNPKLGFKFSTFASFWIKQEIIRAIENKGRVIRVPVNVSKSINKLKKVISKETTELNEIDKSKIAATVKIKEDKIDELIQYFDDSCSIDKLIDKNCFNIFITEKDNLEPEDVAISYVANQEIVEFLSKYLTSREKDTIILRYGLNDNMYKTHQEVAEILQISRERVRQLEASALNKLKKILTSNPEYQLLFSA